MQGRGVKDVPATVYEAMFAFVYHWDLEKIRSLTFTDFRAHAPIVDTLFKVLVQKVEL